MTFMLYRYMCFDFYTYPSNVYKGKGYVAMTKKTLQAHK